MTRVNLPPGCYGIEVAGYKSRRVKPGSHLDIDNPRVARLIGKSSNTELGIISNKELVGIGTKAGRWCKPCKRLWQAWSETCPKCGLETEPE
jgi:hypothetical protein